MVIRDDEADEQAQQPEPEAVADIAAEEDNPRKGIGLGGNIASIIDEAKAEIRNHGTGGDDDDPRSGLGTDESPKDPAN